MDQAYIDKNIADCEKRIESLKARIKNAKATGEDVDDLKQQRDGYADRIAELSSEAPVEETAEAQD